MKLKEDSLLGILFLLSLVSRNYFRWNLPWNFPAGTSELILFGACLDQVWDSRFPEIPSRGFLFALAGASELIPFGASSYLCWNFSAGTSELIPFGVCSDLLWYLRSPEIPFWGFIFAFADASELIPFSASSMLHWNCLSGTSELIPFGASSDLLWDL